MPIANVSAILVLAGSALATLSVWLALVAPAAAQTASPIGDAAAGEKVFVLCSACHRVGPGAVNVVGPVLNGIIGRRAGTYPGFMYSEANKASGIVWDEKTLATYLPDPEKMVPARPCPSRCRRHRT